MEPTQSSETSTFNTQTPGKYPEDNLSSFLLKMEPTPSSETSAFNTQTPGKYPENNLSTLTKLVVAFRNLANAAEIHKKAHKTIKSHRTPYKHPIPDGLTHVHRSPPQHTAVVPANELDTVPCCYSITSLSVTFC
jgi:hypothetical protein